MDNQKKRLEELCDFYEKDSGDVKESLFSDDAEMIVKDFLEPVYPKITKTQIRKFYNEVLSIQNLIDIKGQKERIDEFKLQIPYIKMLIAKAKYSRNKKPPTVNDNFVKFIELCLKNIKLGKGEEDIKKSLDHFNLFVSFFEAVIAYSVVHIKKN